MGGIAYNALRPVDIYEDNLVMGYNLMKAAHEARVAKLVNILPNCTYPGVAEIYRENEWWNGPMHETVLTYGMPRKAVWVHALAMKMEKQFNSIHLVLANLYGPRDHFDPIRSHALGALVRKILDARLLGAKTVEIWGTGAPVREWMYVEDAAEGIFQSMERYEDIEIMNIGTGVGYTITETANAIRSAASWQGEFTYDTSKPDGAPRKILDVTKMRSLLKWTPPTGFGQGIERTVKWYLDSRKAVTDHEDTQSQRQSASGFA